MKKRRPTPKMLWEQRTFVSSSFSFFSFLFFVSSSFSLFSFLFFTNNSFLKKNKHFFIFEKKTNNNNNNNNGSGAPGGVKIDFSSYWLPCLRDEEKETHIKDVVGTNTSILCGESYTHLEKTQGFCVMNVETRSGKHQGAVRWKPQPRRKTQGFSMVKATRPLGQHKDSMRWKPYPSQVNTRILYGGSYTPL